MQAGPGGGVVPVRPVAARPAVRVTGTALLAAAKLVTIHKTTTAGAPLGLAAPQALDRDCVPLGQVVVKVLTPPDHGTIHVGQGTVFSNYQPGDPPFPCNARKTPATLVSYHAADGFLGDDVAVIRIFFPDGRAPTVRYDITVE